MSIDSVWHEEMNEFLVLVLSWAHGFGQVVMMDTVMDTVLGAVVDAFMDGWSIWPSNHQIQTSDHIIIDDLSPEGVSRLINDALFWKSKIGMYIFVVWLIDVFNVMIHTVACAVAPYVLFRSTWPLHRGHGASDQCVDFFLYPLCHRSHQKSQNKKTLKIANPPIYKMHQSTHEALPPHPQPPRPAFSPPTLSVESMLDCRFSCTRSFADRRFVFDCFVRAEQGCQSSDINVPPAPTSSI